MSEKREARERKRNGIIGGVSSRSLPQRGGEARGKGKNGGRSPQVGKKGGRRKTERAFAVAEEKMRGNAPVIPRRKACGKQEYADFPTRKRRAKEKPRQFSRGFQVYAKP